MLDINPDALIDVMYEFVTETNIDALLGRKPFDCIIDGTDSVADKSVSNCFFTTSTIYIFLL